MARGVKYPKGDTAAQVAGPEQQLTEREKKLLARLNRKYGATTVHAAIDNVGQSKRGRPSRGLLPYYEAMHTADWIDEVAEEHRTRGSRTPIRDAENELYEMTTGRPREAGDGMVFEAWRLNIKNKRLRGRRDLAEWKEALSKYRKTQRKNPKG